MKGDWVWFFLGLFLILFGVFSVTNIKVTWGESVMGYAALFAGGFCAAKLLRG